MLSRTLSDTRAPLGKYGYALCFSLLLACSVWSFVPERSAAAPTNLADSGGPARPMIAAIRQAQRRVPLEASTQAQNAVLATQSSALASLRDGTRLGAMRR